MKYIQKRKNPAKKSSKSRMSTSQKVVLFGGMGLATAVGLAFLLTPKKAIASSNVKGGSDTAGGRKADPTPSSAKGEDIVPKSTTTPMGEVEKALTPTQTSGDRVVGGVTLLDYTIDTNPGTVSLTKPYPKADSPTLTVSFERAPALGLSLNPEVIAAEIAIRMGKSSKSEYTPTNDEVRMLAYMLYKERPDTGGRITEIDAQRERAGMLWSVVNRIAKSGKSIKNTISGTDFVGYYKDFDDPTLMDNALTSYPDFKKFVKAFFKGHLQEELTNLTSWVHAGYKYVKRWRSWSLPEGTLDQNGNVISGTSFATPLYVGEALFSRGVAL